MKAFLFILVLVLLGCVGWLLLTRNHPTRTATTAPAHVAPPAPKKEWTPEEIAKDPQAYLAWSDRQIEEQIGERQKRLAQLSDRRGEIVDRQKQLVDKAAEVTNFRNRLKTAYQRAEDEDRWPVRMAGKTFERAKAQDILAQLQLWLDDRRPLLDAYAASVRKMDDSANGLRDDVQSLERLREKLALDLERVRLNQGLAEIDQLRKTATQLASMSQALGEMSEEQSPVLLPTAKSARVDIDSILR